MSDPGHAFGSLRKPTELAKTWGTDEFFTQLLHLTGAQVGLLRHCTKEQFAPLVFAFAGRMETASPELNGEEKSTSCYSSALPSIRSAFNSPALNAQSGVKATFSPGHAEQALLEKKGPQTNKTAGFVCEQTVNCDGVSFNLQIHLSTKCQLQIDRADQKNEYLFQGLTRYPQDTGYLVTYSVNIQGWLTQLSQGICSQLSALLS